MHTGTGFANGQTHKGTGSALVTINGKRLKHDNRPTYLGVALDCTLTHKLHLRKVGGKNRTN